MPSANVVLQTPKEYRGFFTDRLNYLIKRAFSPHDNLSFVTYQPPKGVMLAETVIEHTKKLFGSIIYIEVIEQTFETKKMRGTGQYLDSYHSHLIMKKDDYSKIKHKLEGFDIVEKAVYDLQGLTYKYLVKQAGLTKSRILPIFNNPLSLENLKQESRTAIRILQRREEVVILTRFYFPFNLIISSRFKAINKIDLWLMYIDDT